MIDYDEVARVWNESPNATVAAQRLGISVGAMYSRVRYARRRGLELRGDETTPLDYDDFVARYNAANSDVGEKNMTHKTPTAWKGPQPTAAQISRWISDRRREGATLRIENSEVDGSLMSFQCAYDSDGVLYDWFPAEPAERDDDALIGDATPANRQRRRRHRLGQAAAIAGYESIDQLAAAIIGGEVKITKKRRVIV